MGRVDFILSLTLLLLTGLLYCRTICFDFVDLDDHQFVKENVQVLNGLTPAGVWYAFTTANQGNWTPLTTLSWMLDAQLWGQGPTGFHAINVLFHAINTVLVFWWLRLSTRQRGRSFTVALLFGIHPLHCESVAWIAERRDVLFLFWVLVTFILYSQYSARPTRLKYTTVSVAFLMALLSKSMAVTVPILMLCLDYWPIQRWKSTVNDAIPFDRRNWRTLFLEKLPWLVMSLGVGIITIVAQHSEGATVLNNDLSLVSKCVNALVALSWYVLQTVWPEHLSVLYQHHGDHWEVRKLVIAAVLISAISIWAILSFRKRPYVPVGWAFFLISLMPVLGLLQVGNQAYADRYSYLPQLGLGILFVWQIADWLEWLPQGRKWGSLIATGFAVLFSVQCHRQIETWKNSKTLWNQALLVEPDNAFSNYRVGEWRLHEKEFEKAKKQFLAAISLQKDHVESWLKLGSTYEQQGDLKKAIPCYQHVLELAPNHFLALKSLGRVYQQQGEKELAKAMLQRAVSCNQSDPDVRNRLALLMAGDGNLDAALRLFEDATHVAPNDVTSRVNLGMALLHINRPGDALPHLREAVVLAPGNAAAHLNLGIALEQVQRIPDAIQEYQEAARLAPQDINIRQRLDALMQPHAGESTSPTGAN